MTLSFPPSSSSAAKKAGDLVAKNLPEIPVNTKIVIKRGDTIAEAVFSIIFTTLFLAGTLRNPPFIAWYTAGQPSAPLFDQGIVQQFLPLYLLLIALTLFLMC